MYAVTMECDHCGCELDEIDYYENDGLCDDCLDCETKRHMGMHIVRNYRFIDGELILSIDEDCVNILYDETLSCYRKPRTA